jgi:hypothetical protein
MPAENRIHVCRFSPRVYDHAPCPAIVFSPQDDLPSFHQPLWGWHQMLEVTDGIPNISQESRSVRLGNEVRKRG